MLPSRSSQDVAATAHDARARVVRLQAERHEARAAGVDPAGVYMARLEAAVAEARAAYVTTAVVEIAALRGSLDGALLG